MITFSHGGAAKNKSKQFSEFGSLTITLLPYTCFLYIQYIVFLSFKDGGGSGGLVRGEFVTGDPALHR